MVAGRYRCDVILGEGATSVVYGGLDLQTNAAVAIKCIGPSFGAGVRTGDQLFRREIGVATSVTHPGLVRVFGAGAIDGGGHYIVMELLEGETLEAAVQKRDIPIGPAIDIVVGLLEPLALLHARGFVHRDLKPSNVFLTSDGSIKILDLGIAKHEADASVTRTGTGVGTPHYMAPEQATNARDVGPSADMWSVGAILYRMLVGRVPFDGEGPYDVVVRACTQPLEPLHLVAPDLDARYAALIEHCLSKRAEERPANARVLTDAIRAIREGGAAVAPVAPPSVTAALPATLPPPEDEATLPAEQPLTMAFAKPPAERRRWPWGVALLLATMTGWVIFGRASDSGVSVTETTQAAPASVETPPPVSNPKAVESAPTAAADDPVSGAERAPDRKTDPNESAKTLERTDSTKGATKTQRVDRIDRRPLRITSEKTAEPTAKPPAPPQPKAEKTPAIVDADPPSAAPSVPADTTDDDQDTTDASQVVPSQPAPPVERKAAPSPRDGGVVPAKKPKPFLTF